MSKKQTAWKKLLALMCSLTLCLLLLPAAQAEETMGSEEAEGVIPAGGTPCMITLEDGSQVRGYTFQCERQSELPTAEHLAAATTEQLIEELLESSFNMSHVYCNSPENYEDLVRTNPYVQELLNRDGGVAALLAYYEDNSDLDYIPKSALESLLCSGAVRETATSLDMEEMAELNRGVMLTSNVMAAGETDSFKLNNVRYTKSSTTVMTMGRRSVPVYEAEHDLFSIDEYFFEMEVESYPGVIRLAGPSSYYNCHSYAWYLANTSNRYWIGDVDTYHSDSHTIDSSTASVGQRVVYYQDKKIVHSGIVSQIKSDGTVMVKSKWGQGCLLEHEINNVPDAYKDGSKINTEFCKITNHNDGVTSYNVTKHTVKCSICSYTRTNNHIFDSNQKCMVCGYTKGSPGVLDSLRNCFGALASEVHMTA